MINCFLSWNTTYVRLKVLSKGVSSQGTENKARSFSYVFTIYEVPLSPFFFSGLSFFLLEMLWTWCQFDMSPYI